MLSGKIWVPEIGFYNPVFGIIQEVSKYMFYPSGDDFCSKTFKTKCFYIHGSADASWVLHF